MRFLILFIIFGLCLHNSTQDIKANRDNSQKKLLNVLFGNYNVNAWPSLDSTKPVDVFFMTQLIKIDDVSEKGQSVKIKLHIRQEWKDPFLQWTPSEFDNVEKVAVELKDLWTPRIQLLNKASQQCDETDSNLLKNVMVTITHDGNCTMSFIDFYKSTCAVDVTYFPFDEQTCNVIFGSVNHDEKLLQLKIKNFDVIGDGSEYEGNGEWALDYATLNEKKVKYRLNDEKHSVIILAINIKRKYFFYMMNLVLPCAFIACMIFLVFLLPPVSGERISLGITVLLSMAIFQELSSEKLPSSSDNFPLLGIYYTVSMFEIGMAMALNCLVLNFYHRNQRMSPFIRKILLGRLARLLRVGTSFDGCQDQVRQELTLQDGLQMSQLRSSCDSQADDEDEIMHQNSHNSNIRLMSEDQKEPSNRDDEHLRSMQLNSVHQMSKVNREFKNSCHVKSSLPDSKFDNGTKCWANDWKRASMVLDRMLLGISVIIGVTSALTIFFQAKRIREMFAL